MYKCLNVNVINEALGHPVNPYLDRVAKKNDTKVIKQNNVGASAAEKQLLLQDRKVGRAAYRMVDIEEPLARGQLVRLLDLLQSSDRQEHADGRTQGEENHRLKVQSVVDHRHLQSNTCF